MTATAFNSENTKLQIVLARLLGRWTSALSNAAETLYDSIVPPILGYDMMCKLLTDSYNNSSLYTAETHNLSGLYAWEREAIGDLLAPGKKAIVLAAGGGREAVALMSEGLHVDAWECSENLIKQGNRLIARMELKGRIQPVLPNAFPQTPDGMKYDLCIVGWSAYCHILRQEDRIVLLANAKKVVDGPILISFISKKQAKYAKKALRWLCSKLPGAEAGISLNLVAKPGSIGIGFDEKDIAAEAEFAGLFIEKFKNQPPEYPYALLAPVRASGKL